MSTFKRGAKDTPLHPSQEGNRTGPSFFCSDYPPLFIVIYALRIEVESPEPCVWAVRTLPKGEDLQRKARPAGKRPN
jgi:hypothetical protein